MMTIRAVPEGLPFQEIRSNWELQSKYRCNRSKYEILDEGDPIWVLKKDQTLNRWVKLNMEDRERALLLLKGSDFKIEEVQVFGRPFSFPFLVSRTRRLYYTNKKKILGGIMAIIIFLLWKILEMFVERWNGIFS